MLINNLYLGNKKIIRSYLGDKLIKYKDEAIHCTDITINKNTLSLGKTETSGEPVNLLHDKYSYVANNYIFFGDIEGSNTVLLDKGVYLFKNINGGTFTWVSVTINGSRHGNNGLNRTIAFSLDTPTSVTLQAYNELDPNNDASKLALYTCEGINPQSFTKAGNGYYDEQGNIHESDNDIYTNTITLDSNKHYLLHIKDTATGSSSSNTLWFNYNNGSQMIQELRQINAGGYYGVYADYYASLSISFNATMGLTLEDVELVEIQPSTSVTANKLTTTLTATVEPTNTTDTIVWSVDPAGVVTVVDGLVTAVSNGEAVITATCGTQTATCNVSVVGIV